MTGYTPLGKPGQQGRVAFFVKAGVKVDRHDFKVKRYDSLTNFKALQQYKAVHPARNSNGHTAARPEHAGFLHGLARAFNAGFLGERSFFSAHNFFPHILLAGKGLRYCHTCGALLDASLSAY